VGATSPRRHVLMGSTSPEAVSPALGQSIQVLSSTWGPEERDLDTDGTRCGRAETSVGTAKERRHQPGCRHAHDVLPAKQARTHDGHRDEVGEEQGWRARHGSG
jgi:hypothetical protein